MSRGAVQEIFSPFPSPSYIQLGVYELRLVQEIFSFPWLYILAYGGGTLPQRDGSKSKRFQGERLMAAPCERLYIQL